MKKITFITITLVLMMVFGTGMAMAKNGHSNGNGTALHTDNGLHLGAGQGQKVGFSKQFRRPLFHRFIYCAQSLDLSEEIEAEIASLLATYRDEQAAQNLLMKEALEDYYLILISPANDDTAGLLEAAEETIRNLKTDDLTLKFDLAEAIRSQLTEEELESVVECMAIYADDTTDTSETETDVE